MNEQVPRFEQEAKSVFKRSKMALMAHTIRAVENYFHRNNVSLDVMVERDRFKTRIKGDVVSVLESRFFGGHVTTRGHRKPRVIAIICLHNDATHNLARYCIAHELYHLLLELEGFIANGRTTWPNLSPASISPASTEENAMREDECDCFAQRLCNHHDAFYADTKTVEKKCRFGPLVNPIKTRTLSHDQWPIPFNLDPENPFWKEDFEFDD